MSERKSVTVVESGNGAYAQSVVAGRHRLVVDEPVALGGADAGPAPYDLLMAALGACTSMTLRMYAKRHGWKLDRTTVELTHEKVGEVGQRADRFERIIRLDGDLSEAQRARLLEIAEKCPVGLTLRNSSIVVSLLAPAETAAPDLTPQPA